MARAAAAYGATALMSNHSEFDNAFLDRASADKVGYCVFGRVIDGMDVVDKIRKVKTANKGGHGDVPVDDVVIKSVRRADEKK